MTGSVIFRQDIMVSSVGHLTLCATCWEGRKAPIVTLLTVFAWWGVRVVRVQVFGLEPWAKCPNPSLFLNDMSCHSLLRALNCQLWISYIHTHFRVGGCWYSYHFGHLAGVPVDCPWAQGDPTLGDGPFNEPLVVGTQSLCSHKQTYAQGTVINYGFRKHFIITFLNNLVN